MKEENSWKEYAENLDIFEGRKSDHIRCSLSDESQSIAVDSFEQIQLNHDALPNLDFEELNIQSSFLGEELPTPFYVSAMTAGHKAAGSINYRIAEACNETSWPMMVGSQRRELFDEAAKDEWMEIKAEFPKVQLLGNLGLSQLHQVKLEQVEELVESLNASAMVIHTNPLQEVIQPEGTPQFKNSLEALEELCDSLSIPVVLKETGCGFSKASLQKIAKFKLAAVDLSGSGGTHWGRIEGMRAEENSVQQIASHTFRNWGNSTVESLMTAQKMKLDFPVWASGGIRNGLDAAKAIALGAERVGMARPILEAALDSTEEVIHIMNTFEYELKVAMFCTASKHISDLHRSLKWPKL